MPVSISGTSGITVSGSASQLTVANATITGQLNLENESLRFKQGSYASPSGTGGVYASNDYRVFGGLNFKNIGHFNFREFQYLDIKTNMTSNSLMFMFFAHGYMYNNGNMYSISSGYSYTAPNTIINQFTQNLANCSIASTYRTTSPSAGGYLCVKLNRGSTGYTEGYVTLYFHTHGLDMNSCQVLAYTTTNNAGNVYTS